MASSVRYQASMGNSLVLGGAHDLSLQLLSGDPQAVVVVLTSALFFGHTIRGFAWGYQAEVFIEDRILIDMGNGTDAILYALQWMSNVLRAEADAEVEVGCA